MERRDSRGRRIGRNWWREYIVELWYHADLAWLSDRDDVAIGYATEEKEYAEQHPRPTLKSFMLAMADPNRYEEAA